MQYSAHLGRFEIILDLRLKPLAGTSVVVFVTLLLTAFLISSFPTKPDVAPSANLSTSISSTQKAMFALKPLPTPIFTPTPLPTLWKVVSDIHLDEPIILTPPEKWEAFEIEAAQQMGVQIAQKLADTINNHPALLEQTGPVTPAQAFWLVYEGPVEFHRTGQSCTESRAERGLLHMPCGEGIWGETVNANLVLVFKDATPSKLATHPRWFVHEMGHAFSHATGKLAERDVPQTLLTRTTFAGPLNAWQFSSSLEPGEVFADLFLAWVFDAWELTGSGKLFMEMFVPGWMGSAIVD